jgi:predicted transcriptional regulator
MPHPKLTKLELQVLEALWQKGACSVREIQETFPEPRPAYTTVQTTVYRLERKKALRCVKRISNANIFEAAISRKDAQGRLIDDLLALFGGWGKREAWQRVAGGHYGRAERESAGWGSQGANPEIGVLRGVAGGRGFADLSPCVSGRHWIERHLRGHWNRWMATLTGRFDA